MNKINNVNKIETEHLILRKAKTEDLSFIWKNIWSDKEIADNMLWKVTNTLEEARIRMDKTIKYQSENYAYFVCLKTNNEPIGFAGIYEKEKNIYEESGICIARNHQGNGYAKEIVKVLKDLVFSNLKGEKFIYGCFSTNEKSRRVCLSSGFKYYNSKSSIREHDNMEYISDYYYFDKDMYLKEKER